VSFPKYPKYKDSGCEWLGGVPEHWDVQRLKRICRVFPSNVDKKSVEGEAAVLLCNYTDVYYNDRIVADMEFMPATATDDQIAKFTLRAGDTIITKDSETADDIAVAAYVPHDLPGVVCGYHLSMVRPREGVNGAFVKRLFDSTYAKSCFAVRANGLTRVGLSQYELDNVDMPVPPSAEQAAIATFLDRETAKIDALIAEQQRLIELLQEKRQAVISHAVTKGLNPDAPMKDSGIEWLGEVPEHWGVTRLSRYAVVGNGSTPSRENEDYWRDGDVPWLSSGEVNQLHVTEASEFITAKAMAECSLTMLPKGTVLVGMVGQGKTRGLSALLRIEAAINQNVAGIVPNPLLKPDYLHFVFQAMYEYLREYGRGGNQAALNCEILSAAIIPLPPFDEQDDICMRLANACDQQDLLLAQTRQAIALLQERRSALISAAVTGQIDVRGLAGSEAA
jgi:type I restriction enzyme S subunit